MPSDRYSAEANNGPEAASSARPAVAISGLDYFFGSGADRKQVLFDINLSILPGETVVLTGPSGSGKSTLLTLIGALRAVQKGEIRVLGRSLAGLSPPALARVRRRIGFIFQDHHLFDALSAFQNIRLATELFSYPKGQNEEMARNMLYRLELGDRMDYKPRQLSGGQKQRVAIGRALINRPKLVLADEPTASLDRDTGDRVMRIFQELARSDGCTVLMVTQDKRILEKTDRPLVLENGRLGQGH